MAEMSMVKKVIEANRRAWDDYPKEIDASNVEEVREIAARAAIEAMREPDVNMKTAWLEAGASVFPIDFWEAAFDAALSQGEG